MTAPQSTNAPRAEISSVEPETKMPAFIRRRPRLLEGIARLLRGPDPTPAQAERLSAYCGAIAACGGVVLEFDQLLEDFADVVRMAERRGLVCGGAGWNFSVRLTKAGQRLAAGSQAKTGNPSKVRDKARGSLARRAARATRLRIRLRAGAADSDRSQKVRRG